jgi:hypothetical protein
MAQTRVRTRQELFHALGGMIGIACLPSEMRASKWHHR